MNLDELERAVLRDARDGLAPSAEERRRLQGDVWSRLPAPGSAPRSGNDGGSGGEGSLLGFGAPGSEGGRLAAWGRVELISAGLALGVAVGGVLGFVLGRAASSDGAAREPREPVAQVESNPLPNAPGAAVERDGLTLAASDAPTPAAAGGLDRASGDVEGAAPSSSDAPQTAAPRPRAAPARRRDVGDRAKQESSLAVELSMLQRARRALNADNGRLALGIVQELDERFPRGVLLEERRATRILSLCLLGRKDEARRFGNEFLAQHATSMYAERVRASCAVDTP